MANLKLQLFGAPGVTRDGIALHIGRRKAVALLAYLAVTQRRQPRAGLARLLWPDYDERAGRAEVRRAVATLNRALGSDWLDADRDSVGLVSASELWVDVVVFRRCLQAAAQADDTTAPPLLDEAAKLAQADFLAGFTLSDAPEFEQWQRVESQHLRLEWARGLDQLTQNLVAAGNVPLALEHARRWLAIDFAAAAALRQQQHMIHAPINQGYCDAMLQPARQMLDETAFDDAWRTGSTLTLAEAVAEALEL